MRSASATAARWSRRSHLLGWSPHLAVGLIALPFIVRQNAWVEWSNALWLLEVQTAHVAAHGLPTFFVDAPGQYFYPQFVFYAGPAIALLSYPALLFGAWPVFAAVTAGAFSAASAGVSWTARNLGVAPKLALIPGLLFASTPYLVSNLYGRGAWAEIVAIAALAVAIGAATSILAGRARSPRVGVLALSLPVAVIAGTHNLTLLFGALLAVPLAIVLTPLLERSRVELRRDYAYVAAGALLGVALCGVSLAPDVWLSSRTVITTYSNSLLHELWQFDTLGALLNPTNALPSGVHSTDLHTQTLVMPLAWLLGMTLTLGARRRIDKRAAASLAGLGLLGVAITLLIADPSWWLSFPSTLQSIQFPFRLVSLLSLMIVLAVSVLLTRPAVRGSRVAIIVLALVTVWQLALAADLAVTAKARSDFNLRIPSAASIRASTLPPAFQPNLLQASEYRLITTDPLPQPSQLATVTPIGDDTPPEIQLHGTQPPGTLVATTVVASPLVRFSGDATLAGATSAGFAVLRVDSGAPTTWRATASSACESCVNALVGDAPLALLAGRASTALAALILLAMVGLPLGRWAARRRNPGATSRTAPVAAQSDQRAPP